MGLNGSHPCLQTASKGPPNGLQWTSLEGEPGVRLEALLGAVPVVVEELLALGNLHIQLD